MKLFKYILCLSLINSSCVHLNSREKKELDLSKDNPHQLIYATPATELEIQHIIYTEDKYPLTDFFAQLRKGELTESFKKIRLSYKKSNSKSEVIQKLLKNDFTPVFISVKNRSSKPLTISPAQFNLDNGQNLHAPLPLENLPFEFKEFSSEAALANAYNLTVVVVGTTAVLFLILVATNGHGLDFLNYPGSNYSKSNRSDDSIFNETFPVTRIDYKNFIIQEKVLQPEERMEGLLFFRKIDATNDNKLKLRYSTYNAK